MVALVLPETVVDTARSAEHATAPVSETTSRRRCAWRSQSAALAQWVTTAPPRPHSSLLRRMCCARVGCSSSARDPSRTSAAARFGKDSTSSSTTSRSSASWKGTSTCLWMSARSALRFVADSVHALRFEVYLVVSEDSQGAPPQFLPSEYHEDRLADDSRPNVFHSHHPHAGRSQHSAGAASRRSRASSLVIQHQFTKTLAGPSARGPVATAPPGSSSSPTHSTELPSPPVPVRPSYRLLTNDVTRVLRIESPRDGALAAGGAAEGSKLMANEVMRNLRLQEKQQTAAIFSAARAKQEDALRRRMAQHEASEASSAHRKTNIVHAIRARGAADSLYTGIVLASHTGAPATAKKPQAEFRVRTHKTGRHFKTELFFPSV